MRRWKELIRGTAAVLAAVVLAGAGVEVPARAEGSPIKWEVESNVVPTFEYQKSNTVGMFVTNNEDEEITDIKIEPYFKDEEAFDKWPFQKDSQDDSVTIDKLEGK